MRCHRRLRCGNSSSEEVRPHQIDERSSRATILLRDVGTDPVGLGASKWTISALGARFSLESEELGPE